MVAYRDKEVDFRVKKVSPRSTWFTPDYRTLQENFVAVAVTAKWLPVFVLHFFQNK